MLERIARGADLPSVLNDIVSLVERQSPGMFCTILLLQGEQLHHGAAPSLPDAFRLGIDGSSIGPAVGSCGTAAYSGERVVIDDIATHPYWADYRHLALPYGLQACWSTPIVSPNGQVLGTFAMYYRERRRPTALEIEWVDIATHLASIAILRERTEQELRRNEARARDLARLHSIAATINKSMMRADESQTIYELACRVAVEKGLARFAWLGLLDEAKRQIDVVAKAGDLPLIDSASIRLDDPSSRGGFVHRALATGEPAISHDLPSQTPSHWQALAQRFGLHSCAVLPLRERERVFGLFALYAPEPSRFHDEELQVLTSLASDISFRVESARHELERQRMQEAVRASENLRGLIYDTVADGIFFLDVEADNRYRFTSVNRSFKELFGAPDDAVIGHVLQEKLPESMRAMVLDKYRQACGSKSRVMWEQVLDVRTGIKHVEITIAPIFDASGRCTNFVGTVHDVTARALADSERARLVAQLNQAQRMQALGTLAGGIAHDFNNILAAISGNAGLALEETALDATTRSHLLEIQKASHRAIDLVRQILTFSRHSPPKRESVDPIEVTREALNLLRATLPHTIALESRFAADAPRFEGDSTQFHQIVMNLCTNAAHALPERGGLIRVKLDGSHIDEGGATISNLAAGDYLRLEVSDNGCGMDEATLKRAFDPFFTTRQPGGGTGLGLSVVHGIVQGHQGGVEIRSRPNEGTTVVVYMPAARSKIEQPAAASVSKGHGERVMYVDDEEALVFLMERALGKLGYAVSGFSDPAAALSTFRSQPQEFDVIVTDVSMPGLSGPDLAAEVRRIRNNIPIIMTSGYIRPEDIETAERLRINQLVYKANTIEELGHAVGKEIDALAKQRAQPILQ